jgi:hypothetical protein
MASFRGALLKEEKLRSRKYENMKWVETRKRF